MAIGPRDRSHATKTKKSVTGRMKLGAQKPEIIRHPRRIAQGPWRENTCVTQPSSGLAI
jgi:hypothetical protein